MPTVTGVAWSPAPPLHLGVDAAGRAQTLGVCAKHQSSKQAAIPQSSRYTSRNNSRKTDALGRARDGSRGTTQNNQHPDGRAWPQVGTAGRGIAVGAVRAPAPLTVFCPQGHRQGATPTTTRRPPPRGTQHGEDQE